MVDFILCIVIYRGYRPLYRFKTILENRLSKRWLSLTPHLDTCWPW